MKKIIIDLDNTLTLHDPLVLYEDMKPNLKVIDTLRQYRLLGYYITIFTARNMRRFQGDVNQIKCFTLPLIHTWLRQNDVPFDEIIVGKPWCDEGFYVDDRAIRPDEFSRLSEHEIMALLND